MGTLLWWWGWRLGTTAGAACALLLLAPAGLGAGALALACVPFVGWWIGRRFVERESDRVVAAAIDRVRSEGASTLAFVGAHGGVVVLPRTSSDAVGVRAPRRLDFVLVAVGERSIGVAEGLAFDVRDRAHVGAPTTRELYLDQVVSADVLEGELVVTSASGQRAAFRASQGLHAAVAQIRDRLRTRVAPHVAEPISSEVRVVERQVVVTRCRFCAALTPVDLSTCEACGAKAGGL